MSTWPFNQLYDKDNSAVNENWRLKNIRHLIANHKVMYFPIPIAKHVNENFEKYIGVT